MRVTRTHLEFWQARRLPSWAKLSRNPAPAPSIHACINAHAGLRGDEADRSFAIQNTVTLLRVKQRSGRELREYLRSLALQPGTTVRPEKRAACARKWLRRLEKKGEIQRS